MKGIRSRSEIRRHELLGKLQRPDAAKSISDTPQTLEKWEWRTEVCSEGVWEKFPLSSLKCIVVGVL